MIAQCRGGQVYLNSWSPASGFRVDEVARGPSHEVEIRFVNADLEVDLKVECSGGVPVGSQEVSGEDSGSESGSD
ncbi:MAG: hypothetical protein ABI586_03645 [Candidatus Nanopelagicales bacterium]